MIYWRRRSKFIVMFVAFSLSLSLSILSLLCVWLSRSNYIYTYIPYIPVKVEYNTQYTRTKMKMPTVVGYVRDVNTRNEDDAGTVLFTGTTHFSDATASTTCKISELQHATA